MRRETFMNFTPLYRIEAKITRTDEIGGNTNRANYYLEGRVEGEISGSYEGIDYGSLFKTPNGDAVYVHVHETIKTGAGVISGLRRGYAIPLKTGGYKVRAFVFFQTNITQHAYLNWTVGFAEGTAGPDGLKLTVYKVD